jgi:hypothetical protein
MAKEKKAQTGATSYEPKPQEQKVLDAARERRRTRVPAPRFKIEGTGRTKKLVIDHPHLETGGRLLMEALGTASPDFVNSLIDQLARATGREPDVNALNFMLAVIDGIEPRDEIEAMLAAQMAAVHMATMTLARRLNYIDTIPQQDSAERAFTKLTRTFTTQMEALQALSHRRPAEGPR